MNPELKTEKDYREFARIGQKLGVPVFEAFLTLETFDKNGKRTSYHKQRSHSWTRNAYTAMFSNLAFKDLDDETWGAGLLSFKRTSGVVAFGNRAAGDYDNTTVDGTGAGVRAAAGQDTRGILVGTGTDAESFEDYVLQTQISNGVAAGELSHVESEPHDITYTAGTKTLKNDLTRFFNNNSGGTITVNEIALVRYKYGSSGIEILYVRDKLGAGVDLADTGQLKVSYTISLVFAG